MSDGRVLPYGRQCIEPDDVAAVLRVLESEYLTTGPEIEAFESELAAACGARHAVVVSSGTAALHCAYAAAGIGAGDEVITSPLTFSATANMVLAQQARPVFADIEVASLCLDPRRAAALITPRTRALVPVDFAGHPADMDAFRDLARRHDLVLIEDAAHSIGSFCKGRPVGSLADMTIFSFHPVKTITTGEGGAVLTDSAPLAQRLRDFRNHGMVRDVTRLHRAAGPWYYEVQSLGFNYRLTALQAALGRSQLAKLPRFVQRRRAIVARYRAALAPLPWVNLPPSAEEVAWHLFALQVVGGCERREAVYAALHTAGIAAQVHYSLVNDMPLYRERGYTPQATPIAQAAADALVSLPLFPAMTDADVERVIAALTRLGDTGDH